MGRPSDKKPFIHKDFLLETDSARILYHNYAKDLPIIDYHNHLSPKAIAENKIYDSITALWLDGDHYKWRALRALGIPEKYITGKASDKEKFIKYVKKLYESVYIKRKKLNYQRIVQIYIILFFDI